MTIKGTTGNDTLNGTAHNDIFDVSQGGEDTVSGGAGNDRFEFGTSFDSNDHIDGGTGNDTLVLDGEYFQTNIISIGSDNFVSVEKIVVTAGKSYEISLGSNAAVDGATLTIDGSKLGSHDQLIVVGPASAGSDATLHLIGGRGNDNLIDGAGNDVLIGGAGDDEILISGVDKASGGTGNDLFVANLTAGSAVDGGAGNDTIYMTGNLVGADKVVLTATELVSVEEMDLFGETAVQGSGEFSYDITTTNATVAAGASLLVVAGSVRRGHTLTFDGHAEKDGSFTIDGGQGDDVLIGGAKGDIFNLEGGGNDKVTGGGGGDTFNMGATLTSNDMIDGGAGQDSLTIVTNKTVTLTLGVHTVLNIETISLSGTQGKTFTLATSDGTLAAGHSMTIDGSGIQNGGFTFNGGAESDGSFTIIGGTDSTNNLTGGAGNDIFDVRDGDGSGTLKGRDGDDSFQIGSQVSAGLSIDGGEGSDKVSISGVHSSAISLNMVHVEKLLFAAGQSYDFVEGDNNVNKGGTLIVDAHALSATRILTFDGAAEKDGHFLFNSGNGADDLTGGRQADTFAYDGLQLSGRTRDTIHVFDFAEDKVQFHTVTGIDTALSIGTASGSHIDADLTALFGAGQANELGAHHAVLFTASAGDLSGHTFLIVDGDGTAGYLARSDLVIELTGALHTGMLGTANFTG